MDNQSRAEEDTVLNTSVDPEPLETGLSDHIVPVNRYVNTDWEPLAYLIIFTNNMHMLTLDKWWEVRTAESIQIK